MRKRFYIAAATACLVIAATVPAYADEWKSDSHGWWFEYNNGSCPKNQWAKINNQWYYFGSDGYMYSNTTTPDGYVVAESGEMVIPGKAYMDIVNSGKTIKIVDNLYGADGKRTELIDHGAYYELTNVTLETDRLYDINLSAYKNGSAIVIDRETLYIRDMDKNHTSCSLYTSRSGGYESYNSYLQLSEDGKHFYRIESEDDAVYQDVLYQGSVYCSKDCIVNELKWTNDGGISDQSEPSTLTRHYTGTSGNHKYYTESYLYGSFKIDKNGLITQIDQFYTC